MASIPELHVGPHYVQSVGEVCLVFWIGCCAMTFSLLPIIIVLWVRPWVTMDWNPGIMHFSVSRTFSSGSNGSSVVLVGNWSLSPRLA